MVALLINSLASGGAERIVLNIAENLYKQGDKVVLLCLIKKNEYPLPEGLPIVYLSEESEYKRGFKFNKLTLFPRMLFKLKKIVKDKDIHTVQSHLFSSAILNVLARKMGARHRIQIVNHMHINYEKSVGLSGYLKIASLKYTYRRADLLISISKKMKDNINELILKRSAIDHRVIYNPHDINGILEKTKEEITDFSFNRNTKYIVTAGRLVDRKQVDILIESFAYIQKQYPATDLLILGDGLEYDKLVSQSEKLGLQKKIHFLGFTQNPFKYIARCDLFVLASRSEGLPNAVIEAMICHTPVISTDCPTGPREILAPDTDHRKEISTDNEISKYGILTPIGSVKLLSQAIDHYFSNESLFKEKAQEGFKFVQQFSTDKIIAQYKKILLPN